VIETVVAWVHGVVSRLAEPGRKLAL
jgi:hypothetical protein